VLALAASVTVGLYAQGGGGGRAGGAGRQAGPPQPGNLITGAWGEKALTPDSRGWGWMVKTYVANAQRPLYNQAKEKLLQIKPHQRHDLDLQPRTILRIEKALDYLVQMQHSTLSFNGVQRMIGACPGLAAALT
jgi:hypothetical protein